MPLDVPALNQTARDVLEQLPTDDHRRDNVQQVIEWTQDGYIHPNHRIDLRSTLETLAANGISSFEQPLAWMMSTPSPSLDRAGIAGRSAPIHAVIPSADDLSSVHRIIEIVRKNRRM